MTEEYDCIIVGAGIGGLLTGAALSRGLGLKTLILEKTGVLGGRSGVIEKEGFLVDNGLHVIRYCKKSPTVTIFKKLLGKKEKVELINLGDAKFFSGGEWYDYPLSAATIETTTFFNEEEREQFKRILGEEIIGAKVDELFDKSVKDWIDEMEKKYEIKPGPARIFLEALSKLILVSYGNLDKLSMGELIAGIQLGLKAVKTSCYPAGGWRPLIENLAKKIESNGEIRKNTKVDKVIVEDKKVVGAQIGDKTIKSKIVVVDIPAQEIFNVLDEELFSKDFVEKCKSLIPTAGISIDYGLKEKISELNGMILSSDPFTMSNFTSNIDPTIAPEGKQLYTIFQPTPVDVVSDKEKSDEVVENIEKLLEEMFPGFSEKVQWRRAVKRRMVDGAVPFITQHRNKRPSVKSDEIEGLYFTGDTYNGPGTGGEIAHASAELCIKTIMKDLNLAIIK
ncbi:MAG: NAD(P)/FAD-dependent oxidoreductase [Candidatus Helarchaeota archaeon]|nr:NAD(P)/FAD-dependent oxidoreductase [Candidatus Helarchaeota archaeon]